MEENKEYPFEFSVVMAVYNVEPFLREAVDSLIQQDFGFERIQLIMVDDGSTDGSGALCDVYAVQYPENVLVIHKENGGASSARNEGLKHIKGRYINFLDSDDKLDQNAMSEVHIFFEEHEEETDVVAIPMFFFDGEAGPHKQNEKFEKGTRVLYLLQDWKTVQLSCASAFIKAEAASRMRFDVDLAFCEDGKEMQKILLEKMALGVVQEASYQYRRRTQGSQSAIQSSENNPQWYMPYLKRYTAEIIAYSLERKGYVPKYVQYSLLYDLQWRFKQEHIPSGVMTEGEEEAYKEYIFSLMKYFDDEVIMAQKDIPIEHKAFLLKKKYRRDADIQWGHYDAVLHYQSTYICHLNMNKTHLDFITMTSDSLCLEGYTVLIAESYGEVQVFLEVNGEKIPCVQIPRTRDRMSLGEPIYVSYGFKCEIPIAPDVETYTLSLLCEVNGRRLNRERLVFGKYCPISSEYHNSYYCHHDRVLETDGKTLYVRKCGRKGHIGRECAYLKELWISNKIGARKAVLARLLATLLKRFSSKKIWLISDRINKADDNGEAFFQYMVERAPKDIKSYFAISPESADYKRLKKTGRVIPFLGWRYKLLYLLGDCIISSQGEEYIFHPFQECSGLYRDMAQTQKFIFLQHGVTKDDLSGWLNRYNKNISMFVTTTVPEYESILTYQYDYTPAVVKMTGFPRYDRLYRKEKKRITIMPTWRAYLVTGIDAETGKRQIKPGYLESKYFSMYDRLLNCQRLFDAAEKLGYTIAFLDHPNMLCTKEMRNSDKRLKEWGQETPYREIFAESDLLITDYSSVVFDFTYLRKPVIYFQEDVDEFFSGAHTYEKGYFDYERDGFGEVEYSVETLVDRIIEYMENGCELKDKYRKRIDATFPFSDQNNCQRVYEEIIGLGDKT